MPVTQKDHKWISLARKVAAKSQHSKYCMGSVIIKAGAVVNIGINKQAAPKPYVKSFRDGLHLHAEIDALIGLARKVTKGCTIYTTGFTTKTRSAIMTLACETCKYFCIQMGIRRLVYTTKESEIKELIL